MSNRPINEHPTYSLAARNIALRQERDELRAQYEALAAETAPLREYYEAHQAIERGVASFDLHDSAVSRLVAAEARVRAVLDTRREAQDKEREGQMLAEQWREHEEQTRP